MRGDFESIVGKAIPNGRPLVFSRAGGEAVLTGSHRGRPRRDSKLSLRKEVIQPQVPLRLPCYDLVPVTEPSVGTTVLWPLRLFPAPMT